MRMDTSTPSFIIQEFIENKRIVNGLITSQENINFIDKKINDNSFLRVFCSLLKIKKIRKFDIFKLGYDLMDFYNDDKYKDLFEMPVKNQDEVYYVDLSYYLEQAMLTGLISSMPIENTNDTLILLTKEQAQDIIKSYDYAYISKMNDLVDKYIARIRFRNLKVACHKYPKIQLNPNSKPYIIKESEASKKLKLEKYIRNNF